MAFEQSQSREEHFQQRAVVRQTLEFLKHWEKLGLRDKGSNGTQGMRQGQITKDCKPAQEGLRRNLGFSVKAMRSPWRVLSRRVNYLITFLKITLVTVEGRRGSRQVSLATLAFFHERMVVAQSR